MASLRVSLLCVALLGACACGSAGWAAAGDGLRLFGVLGSLASTAHTLQVADDERAEARRRARQACYVVARTPGGATRRICSDDLVLCDELRRREAAAGAYDLDERCHRRWR